MLSVKLLRIAVALMIALAFLLIAFSLLDYSQNREDEHESSYDVEKDELQEVRNDSYEAEESSAHESPGSEQVRADAERIYPSKIKSAFVKNYGMVPPWERTDSLLSENLQIKERLGANTYHVFVCYTYSENSFDPCGPLHTNDYSSLREEIRTAKEHGMRIDLWSSWGVNEGVKLKSRNDLDRFFDMYEQVLINDAKFAEEENVEYFSLNEPDHLINSQEFSVSENERVEIINSYKNSALQKIRKVYNGKVYYQIGDATEWDFTVLDVSGLDFFGVLINGGCDYEAFRGRVDEVFSRAERLSEKYNISWAISELIVSKQYEDYDACDLHGKRTKYYEYVFNKSINSSRLIGIMIDTWNVDEPGFETSVKDTASEHSIREFFMEWD